MHIHLLGPSSIIAKYISADDKIVNKHLLFFVDIFFRVNINDEIDWGLGIVMMASAPLLGCFNR